ncbi:MAG: fibronectin type III domain-containing protein [Terriglobales bacterium]
MRPFPIYAIVLLLCSLAVAQVKITTTSLPDGTVKTLYSATINTTGGETPFEWSSVSLPSGLTLKPSSNTRSATLTGTPTKASTHKFDLSVKGHAGHISTVDYTLTIEQGASHSADLTWKAGAKNITGYNVYRSTSSGGPYSQINPSLLSANSYTDSDVADGTTYFYVATEVNKQGEESGYSAQTEAQIPQN